MEQTTTKPNGKTTIQKPHKAARSETIYIKATLYLNKRSEGFCDCCLKVVPPSELIRFCSRKIIDETEYSVVSYLCAKCDEA